MTLHRMHIIRLRSLDFQLTYHVVLEASELSAIVALNVVRVDWRGSGSHGRIGLPMGMNLVNGMFFQG